MDIDWITVSRSILDMFVAIITGSVSAFIVYRFARARDIQKWERELTEQRRQWELEQQERLIDQIRADLLRGIENPTKAINSLTRMRVVARHSHRTLYDGDMFRSEGYLSPAEEMRAEMRSFVARFFRDLENSSKEASASIQRVMDYFEKGE